MAERDYPVGHPAACDYAGEPYTPQRAPWSYDFAEDHPARAGKNIDAASSPDGLRKQVLEHHAANAQRTEEMQRTSSAEE